MRHLLSEVIFFGSAMQKNGSPEDFFSLHKMHAIQASWFRVKA